MAETDELNGANDGNNDSDDDDSDDDDSDLGIGGSALARSAAAAAATIMRVLDNMNADGTFLLVNSSTSQKFSQNHQQQRKCRNAEMQ